MADLTAYTNVMKVFYLPAIRNMLNDDMILTRRIDRGSESISGKNATIVVKKGRSKGHGAAADGAAIPQADPQKYDQLIIPTKYQYGRIEITGPTISATRDSRGAYVNALDNEIMGIAQDLKKDINRQFWGCGYAILATWAADDTNPDIMKSYLATSGGAGGFGSTFGAKYMFADSSTPYGTQLTAHVLVGGTSLTADAINTARTTAVGSQCVITAITDTGASVDELTMQTDFGVTEAIGTIFCLHGSGPTGTTTLTRREMMGLRGIITDTDIDDILTDGTTPGTSVADPLQNIAVGAGANNWWKAAVFKHASGRYAAQRAMTIDLLEQCWDAPWERRGEHPTIVLSSTSLRRKYFDLAAADRRHVNTMTLDGGYKALEFNGVGWVVDTDAIDGEVYMPNESHLKVHEMANYDWMDRHGAMLFPVTGFDKYEAVIFRYAELATDARNAHSMIADLAYTKAVY